MNPPEADNLNHKISQIFTRMVIATPPLEGEAISILLPSVQVLRNLVIAMFLFAL